MKRKKSKNEDYSYSLEKLPENVLLLGFTDILKSYGIILDDYGYRKLLYHILISIGYFFFHHPDRYLQLEGVVLYRNLDGRNSFVMDIDKNTYKNDVNMQGLYDYFIGGLMDYEELGKNLDQYALSYIEYAYKLYSKVDYLRTYLRKLEKDYKEAKIIAKVLGIVNIEKSGLLVRRIAKRLKEDRKEARELLKNKKLDKND